MTTVRHVILDRPLRCCTQMFTAGLLAESHGATTHLTPGCYGEPTRKRPGTGSSCMPRTERGFDRCRHDLAQLRREGAVDITPAVACWRPTWQPADEPCEVCGGKWRPDGRMAFFDQYPVVEPLEQYGQPTLFGFRAPVS